MAINECVIMGRLTADVELRSTQSGVSVCNFTVAVDRQYKKDEERITDWIDCVAWKGTAEFIEKYFHKGDMIAVVGSVQTRNWEDQNGNKRKSTELIVDNVSFAGNKREMGNTVTTTASNDDSGVTADDDIPF